MYHPGTLGAEAIREFKNLQVKNEDMTHRKDKEALYRTRRSRVANCGGRAFKERAADIVLGITKPDSREA